MSGWGAARADEVRVQHGAEADEGVDRLHVQQQHRQQQRRAQRQRGAALAAEAVEHGEHLAETLQHTAVCRDTMQRAAGCWSVPAPRQAWSAAATLPR